MTDGQVLIGSTGGTPVPATITVGSGLTIINSAGSITISASARAFGEVTKTFATSSQSVTANVWGLWSAGTFSSGELSEFTRSTTRLTYTGATTKTFIAHWKISTTTTSSASKEGAIYKNGVRLESSRAEFRNTNGGGGAHSSEMTATGFSTFTLATNDYIEPWVLSSLSETFSLQHINMIVYQVS
jgi:hypothetical protein